jgi:hypothetical protein
MPTALIKATTTVAYKEVVFPIFDPVDFINNNNFFSH